MRIHIGCFLKKHDWGKGIESVVKYVEEEKEKEKEYAIAGYLYVCSRCSRIKLEVKIDNQLIKLYFNKSDIINK